MKLETAFNLGQRVHAIHQEHAQKFIPCKQCNGVGEVEVDGATYGCNSCYGRKGSDKYVGMQWVVNVTGEVGKVQTSIEYSPNPDEMFNNVNRLSNKTDTETQYMLCETGVGSGSVYYEERVFGEESEAESECNKRNKKLVAAGDLPHEAVKWYK